MVLPTSAGIYKITNATNGKVYIGSAVNLRTRWHKHRSDRRRGIHHSITLQRAWSRYGADAFSIEVVEQIEDRGSLTLREQHWMDLMRAANPRFGYNICPTAGNCLGVRRDPAVIEKTAAKIRGTKRSPETCALIGLAHRGKVLSPETRAKIAARFISDETRRKISVAAKRRGAGVPAQLLAFNAARKGKPQTADLIARRAAALIGHEVSEATRAKLAAASTGKTHSEEARLKMSLARRGKKQSAEHVRKRMASRMTTKAGKVSDIPASPTPDSGSGA